MDGATRTVTLRGLDNKPQRRYIVTGFGTGAQWDWQQDSMYGPTGIFAATRNDGNTWHYHPDHLGSPRILTNQNGSYVSERHYHPYGAEFVRYPNRPDDISAKFTGHERDANGLTDYMLGRTYVFPLGRFGSVDPARDGWNLYGYVGANPMGAVDPTGLEVVEPKDGRTRKALKKIRSTPEGEKNYQILKQADGTYSFEPVRTRVNSIERQRIRKMKQQVVKQAGHLKPAYEVREDGKGIDYVSGGVLQIDYGIVDNSADEPYDGKFGDEAILSHEMGHGVMHELSENKLQDFINTPYEIQEDDANSIRDAILGQLRERED